MLLTEIRIEARIMMMKPCETFDHALSEYRDGVLSQVEQEKVESHLKECEACSHSLEDFALVGSALVGERLAPLPRALVRRLDRSFGVVSATQRRERGRAFLTGGAAAAVLLLSLFCAYEYGKSKSIPSEPIATHAVLEADEQVRAARAVASDLAVIERIPEHLRIPLLRSQMDTYRLAHWARETMTAGHQEPQVNHLVKLVLDLEPALRSKDATQQILRVAARAPTRSWVASVAPTKPPRTGSMAPKLRQNQSFRFVIDSQLSEQDRQAMRKTLMLKELIVRKETPSALCAMVLASGDRNPTKSPLRAIELASFAAFSEELKPLGSAVRYAWSADGNGAEFMATNSGHPGFTIGNVEEVGLSESPTMLLQHVQVMLGGENDGMEWISEMLGDGTGSLIIRRERQAPSPSGTNHR